MGLKDLVVLLDTSKQSAIRLELAIALATVHEAHLTGLYVSPPPDLPPVRPYLTLEMTPAAERGLAERVEREAAGVEASFRRRVDHAGLSRSEWRCAAGDAARVACLHARHADFTVIGQPSDDDAAVRARRDLAERLIFASGRPILMVPYAGTFPTAGDRVVVAWNGSREATRAVNDALPILQRARQVTVLTVNPHEEEDQGDVPGADIALHLARHGVTVEAAETVGHDIEVADILLSRLADGDADLLVMGAYGHSRLREMILGGATRHILRSMTVPVLLSH